jgi:Family of unknown function (DUF5343)
VSEEIPYLASISNVDAIIQKIRGAGTPPKFTHDFLSSSLGFRSSNDRGFIKVLRTLGMVASDGTPTDRYNAFKNQLSGGSAMADGLREGWSAIYLADTLAHTRNATELQETFKTVTGKSDSVAKKMATTFKALAKFGDFNATAVNAGDQQADEDSSDVQDDSSSNDQTPIKLGSLNLRHDVHLHLPPTSDVAVYTAIFRALREELLD